MGKHSFFSMSRQFATCRDILRHNEPFVALCRLKTPKNDHFNPLFGIIFFSTGRGVKWRQNG